MEFISQREDAGYVAAPRLAQTRPDSRTLAPFWEQLRAAMAMLARLGFAHGDLSPYNILVDGDRLVLIDLPQVVDIAANPFGAQLLARDCRNMAAWFTAHGLAVDADELFADPIARAW